MAVDLDHIRAMVDRVAASNGLEVVDVELRGGGKGRMLRIFVDKPEGVTHEDCAGLSREISTIFDVEDAVPGGSYTLEVSSPGLDRKLSGAKDFERFQGSRVKLTTREPVNGNRHFEGRLKHFEGGRLMLDLAAAEKKIRPAPNAGEALSTGAQGGSAQHLEIDLANVEKANLVPEI